MNLRPIVSSLVLSVALSVAGACNAGFPAGGLDLITDYWIDHGPQQRPSGPFGIFGGGPARFAVQGLQISGVENTGGTASAVGAVVSTERALSGPFFIGGSAGSASSDDMEYSGGSLHFGLLINPFFSLRLGYNQETWDYPTNLAAASLASNESSGVEVGLDLFGSPYAGWFFQISADVVPLSGTLRNGTEADLKTEFSMRGNVTVGMGLWENIDLMVTLGAQSDLGDQASTALQAGAGLALTF